MKSHTMKITDLTRGDIIDSIASGTTHWAGRRSAASTLSVFLMGTHNEREA